MPFRLGAGLLLAICLLLMGCGSHATARVHHHSSAGAQASPHVFVIMMENKGAGDIVGNPAAPFINRLIHRYGFAARYYAVTHPSLPNYVATIAGSTFGSTSDDDSQRFPGASIATQLTAAGLTWRAYMESMPRPGYAGDVAGSDGAILYDRKHDPFLLMSRILGSSRQRSSVVPASRLPRDLTGGQVATLSWITPNLCHDMHGLGSSGPCPTDQQGLIRTGDRYLGRLVPEIMRSQAWSRGGIIFLVWDEAAESDLGLGSPGYEGGRVPMVVIAAGVNHHAVSHTLFNHYSLLKTMERLWRLPCLRQACAPSVRPMTALLRP